MINTPAKQWSKTMSSEMSGHIAIISEYGDGYHEPREESVYCECGAHIWDWQQYYQETPDWEQDWLDHLAFVEYGIDPTPIYWEIRDDYGIAYSQLNQELTRFGRIDCAIATGAAYGWGLTL